MTLQQAENSALLDAKIENVLVSFIILLQLLSLYSYLPLPQPDIKDKKHFLNNEKTLVNIISKHYLYRANLFLTRENTMKKLLLISLFLGSCATLPAQKTSKIPTVYKPVSTEMYNKGWIDFNKNGIKDVYEDPSAPIDARIEDLLSQMTLEEKTCQMVTLYGYKRVLKDDLPTPEWKNQLWKDGIGAIDEHLNGFQQWGLPPSDNEYVLLRVMPGL